MPTKLAVEGRSIILRPLQPTDLDAYVALTQDTEALRLTGTQGTFTGEGALRWLASLPERDDRVDWGIILCTSTLLIGEVVLNNIDTTNHSASVRIALLTPYTNQGYGREALELVMAYAFDSLRLHRLELSVYAFNQRAIHVYECLGFRQEGRRREVLYVDGVYHDVVDMAILEQEYRTRNKA